MDFNLFRSSWGTLLAMELNFHQELEEYTLLSLKSDLKDSVKRNINLNLELSLIKLLSWINKWEISWTEPIQFGRLAEESSFLMNQNVSWPENKSQD